MACIDLYEDYAVLPFTMPSSIKLRVDICSFRYVFPKSWSGYEKSALSDPGYESAHLFGQEAPEHFLIFWKLCSLPSLSLNDG